MVDENKTRPIIIKRVKKHGEEHHGGSWKIAFADFMTALFAIMLVLWLLAAADEEARIAVGDYFRDPTLVERGPVGGVPTVIDLEGGADTPLEMGDIPITTEEWLDQEEMYDIADAVYDALTEEPGFDEHHDQITLDVTDDGLRIQLLDRENRPMFDLGSARLHDFAREILLRLGGVLGEVENPISISGHTDARAFVDRTDYDNWDLSTDRAHSARRVLLEAGLGGGRFGQIVGYADTVPFDGDDPYAAVNRRISILLMSRSAMEAIAERERMPDVDAGLERLEPDRIDLLTPEERLEREQARPPRETEAVPEPEPSPEPSPEPVPEPEPAPPEDEAPQVFEPGDEAPPRLDGGVELLTPEERQRRPWPD